MHNLSGETAVEARRLILNVVQFAFKAKLHSKLNQTKQIKRKKTKKSLFHQLKNTRAKLANQAKQIAADLFKLNGEEVDVEEEIIRESEFENWVERKFLARFNAKREKDCFSQYIQLLNMCVEESKITDLCHSMKDLFKIFSNSNAHTNKFL